MTHIMETSKGEKFALAINHKGNLCMYGTDFVPGFTPVEICEQTPKDMFGEDIGILTFAAAMDSKDTIHVACSPDTPGYRVAYSKVINLDDNPVWEKWAPFSEYMEPLPISTMTLNTCNDDDLPILFFADYSYKDYSF